jgi:hypothetical protein
MAALMGALMAALMRAMMAALSGRIRPGHESRKPTVGLIARPAETTDQRARGDL